MKTYHYYRYCLGFCSLTLLIAFFITPSSQTPADAVTKAVPALGSIRSVLEEASEDLQKKGDGRKSVEKVEDMEKRLREIWPLEQALWNRSRHFESVEAKLSNSSAPRSRSSSNKRHSSKRLPRTRRFCILRIPTQ